MWSGRNEERALGQTTNSRFRPAGVREVWLNRESLSQSGRGDHIRQGPRRPLLHVNVFLMHSQNAYAAARLKTKAFIVRMSPPSGELALYSGGGLAIRGVCEFHRTKT